MKESRLYLNFFKQNFLLISITTLFFLGLGIFEYVTQPPIQRITTVIGLDYSLTSPEKTTLAADQIVGMLREKTFRKNLGVMDDVSFNVYKNGPFAVTYKLERAGESVANSANLNLQANLVKNYILTAYPKSNYFLADGFEYNSNFRILHVGLFLLTGFVLGVAVSLVKTYLRKY